MKLNCQCFKWTIPAAYTNLEKAVCKSSKTIKLIHTLNTELNNSLKIKNNQS